MLNKVSLFCLTNKIIMKSNKIIYCLMVFCMFALVSCGPKNVDYANKVIGDYNVEITPSLSLKYEGGTIPLEKEVIKTKCSITKSNENGDVVLIFKGVNGIIGDIEMSAYCSGLGMKIENCGYKGNMTSGNIYMMNCEFYLNNSTLSISNDKIFNWNPTVSGSCKVDYIGLDITCNVTGSMNFYLTPINK